MEAISDDGRAATYNPSRRMVRILSTVTQWPLTNLLPLVYSFWSVARSGYEPILGIIGKELAIIAPHIYIFFIPHVLYLIRWLLLHVCCMMHLMDV